MKNQFSTEQPNKTKDIINSLLKELNFFDKSPPRYTDEVNKRELFKCSCFDLLLMR